MAFGDDEDILQDFLVEAGEIIEQLSEQLVDLEQRPDDRDLLNAIFRGFHTVKGGAGFLQLNAMVDCCHVTENLFDILRNGEREVTAELMDVVLQALDTVNSQFAQVSSREEPSPAAPELIAALERLVSCQDLSETADDSAVTEYIEEVSVDGANAVDTPSNQIDITDDEFEGFLDAITDETAAPMETAEDSAADILTGQDTDEITEEEFEQLLDKLHGQGKGPGMLKAAASSPSPSVGKASEEISEDEFEDLLDQLHGVGKGPGAPGAKAESSSSVTSAKPSSPPPPSSPGKSADLISDDEFEDLLDQLHGKGKGPTIAGKPEPVQEISVEPQKTSASPSPAQAKPAAPSQAKPAAPKPRENNAGGGGGGASPVSGETTVRVDTQRLDDIMNMVGELVLVRNRLVRLGNESSDEQMQKAVANLDVVTADLQSSVMKTRMQPIKKVFGRFPRVVRDLARNLKKEINLELLGEETDLDKNLVEALADPLVHLVRNSVDHGIELPSDREAKGKPRVGKVILAAEQEGDHILLSISDDGGGMDADRLRSIAVEKGILDTDAAQRLSDSEAFNLIFAPGFSTKKEISDVSGRGVGMDVVKTKITQLNGSIDIESKLGEGTKIVIKVPLTLAIMPTLMIMVGEQAFALPLVSVNEIFHMDLTRTNIVDGQECITIREKAIPIFHLKRWLIRNGYSHSDPKEGHVVIVTVGTQRVGFVVDQLIGQEEVVIKPLGKMLHGTPGMAGATITGDGTIALILDVPSMLKRYAGAA
ncbi:chemotaxis protein CheA [Teredinibacter sp. KSP-S5-2]|uniref:chemotaxis protein CheA n=1 Tax=Teredinibacter sp. KSP-S5-2 TaxID=3034506 RepID=UPI0029342280|nr:chemotaxis protein CheA [Teredinibacter sp. KSP-S5-2]WNO07890.1 chemotaxis protein CheA [Teredinibacter sp. KSP-S5-2]